MSIAKKLIGGAFGTVAVGPFEYRYRRVSTALLFEAGAMVKTLLAAPTSAPEGEAAVATAAPAAEGQPPDELAQLRTMVARALAEDDNLLAESQKFMEGVVAAGVVAAREAGSDGPFLPLEVVLDVRKESEAHNRVHVTSLLPGTVVPLARAILEHSKGGVAPDALGSFPRGEAAPRGASRAVRQH